METPAEKDLQNLDAKDFIEILEGKKRGEEVYKKFYRKWESFDEAVVIEGVRVTGDIELPASFQAELPIILTGESQFRHFWIRGGKFSSDFSIEGNTFFSGFGIFDGLFSGKFKIGGGTFSGNFWLSGGTFSRSFEILEGKFLSYFGIGHNNIEFDNFKIKGGTFSDKFEILNGVFSDEFGIDSGNFLGDFVIKGNSNFNNFYVNGGTFSGTFAIEGNCAFRNSWIYEGEFLRVFEINGGDFNEEFTILGGKFIGSFHISRGNFQKGFKISWGSFSSLLKISGGSFSSRLAIENGRFTQLLIRPFSSLFIETLHLSIQPTALPLIQMTSGERTCTINTLRLENVTLQEEEIIQVNGLNFNQIEFVNVLNYGNITLTAVGRDETGPPTRKLTIQNSDLGKTTLIGCDFSEAEFCLESSKITEMFVTAGTKLPEKLSHQNAEQLRVGYGQLKKVYENRGDVTEANKYFARQMNAYQETLTWRKDFWEMLNLRLNRVSTNHGTNWQKGLAMTLGVSAAFFGGYLLALGLLPGGSANYFFKVWSYFLEFINPIHNADFIADELKIKPTSGGRFIEGLSRIFIAYFIYQLIQAFRKHGRKGD